MRDSKAIAMHAQYIIIAVKFTHTLYTSRICICACAPATILPCIHRPMYPGGMHRVHAECGDYAIIILEYIVDHSTSWQREPWPRHMTTLTLIEEEYHYSNSPLHNI